MKDVKYVLVWGISARHYPQHCGLGHVLQDEDVVQIVKKKVGKKHFLCFSCLIGIIFPFLHSCFIIKPGLKLFFGVCL